MKILIIEPDNVLLNVYTHSLKKAGYQVSSAHGAQAGIIIANKLKPDLVILELQLIEHSGIEFLYELRSYTDWQDIPVVINTIVPPAEFNNSRKLLMHDLGVDRYLYKPNSSLHELLSVVNELNLVTA